VLHTPGHTKGHICLYEPERGLLFTGDHVISAGLSWILPTRGDVKEYVQSLKRLLKLRISLILPGHGRPLRSCRSVLLDRLARVSSRERSILRLLRKGPMDEDSLLKGLWCGGNPLKRLISRPVLRAYLKKLLDERRIAIVRAGNRTFYALS
ncbi:MAG TPA: MBL fold metallo-hydrolase, partial [Candidatus Bathyarchaeota archaeon]|nr:MBL fold metallo-hydrolase [Candidatus Bathyarchaeota archaeon]